MNMRYGIFNFVEVIANLFASWLFGNHNEWAWCPVKVDNQHDGF